MKTPHGHTMADVYSCFQKYVRRGDFENAVYWASQIALPSTGSTMYKGYPNALRKRLLQHALEDVGNIDIALQLLDTPTPSWDALVPWIQRLCLFPKTRAAAWANRVAVEYIENPSAAPTLLLTRCAEALVLHRDEKITELSLLFPKPVMKLYKEINKEVLAFHAYSLKALGILDIAPSTPPATLSVSCSPVNPDWLVRRDVPDWAYDKHTARGKSLGRGYEHFFETMVIHPRLLDTEIDMFEAEAKALYLNGKEQRVRHILSASKQPQHPEPKNPATGEIHVLSQGSSSEAPSLPPSSYVNIIQIQPLTAKSKPRVWFAENSEGKQVVIKGPMTPKDRNAVISSEAMKIRLGLPHSNVREDGVFLVSDSLVDYKTFGTRSVTTKLEQNVQVIDSRDIDSLTWNVKMLEEQELARGILIALAFRKLVGANDTCDRNFVVRNSIVFSLDDAALNKDTTFMWKKGLQKQKARYIAALEAHWTYVEAELKRWVSVLGSDVVVSNKRFSALLEKDGWVW